MLKRTAVIGLVVLFVVSAADRCRATVVGEDDFESYGALNPAPDPLDGTASGGLLWNYIDGQGDGNNTNDHRTFLSPAGGGAGMGSVGWISLEEGGGIGTSLSLASLAGTAFDNGAGGIVNGSVFDITFTVAAETSNVASNIGFTYDIASSGGALGFVSGGSADGSTVFASLADGGTVVGGTTGASDDRLMTVRFDATGTALADTVDFSFTRGTGTNNPFIFFDDFVLNALDGITAEPALVIDRDTGNITLTNDTVSSVANIIGYSIVSDAGSLDQNSWNRQADGSQLANDDDDWTVLTAPGVETDLSEAVLTTGGAGNGGDLLELGGTWDYGNVWRKSPFEDIQLELLLDDGSELVTGTDLSLSFTGNNDMPFAFGDLTTNGTIDVLDWIAFKGVYGTDVSGLTQVSAYLNGDLTGNGVSNLDDFIEFRTLFDAANGAGSFDEMLASIPEPSSWVLGLMGGFAFLRRRRGKSA